jgi:hypothetical protein
LIFIKKIIKLKKKLIKNQNRPVSVLFLEQKPTQTSLARFWLNFFSFGSVFFGLSSVQFGFFNVRLIKPNQTG